MMLYIFITYVMLGAREQPFQKNTRSQYTYVESV